MSGWRHVDELAGVCASWVSWKKGRCPCTTPTPDPASPCGYEGCWGKRWTHAWVSGQFLDESSHPHVPTRCNCGHPIERVDG